jgi:hypothetical protein
MKGPPKMSEMSYKQREANHRNALRSTGPRTPEGVEGCKMNAFRHGLRAVRIVVPGENSEDWEEHRAAIVAELALHGAMEFALAEQCALKLWRLARVVRFERDLIANAQAEDELLQTHEKIHQRDTIIPTRADVGRARHAVSAAAKKLTAVSAALEELQALASMQDDEVLPSLALYELLCAEFRPAKKDLEGLFKGAAMNLFQVRHANKLILMCFKGKGELDELRVILAAHWSSQLDPLRSEIQNRQAEHDNLGRRYEEALERRRLASGLPDANDLDRIQRYEAHLERGLHRDLDRLHDLKAARGAVPPRGPSVAVAVVQAGSEAAAANEMASFGSFHVEAVEMVEAAEMTEGPAGVDAERYPFTSRR